jgi:hypothetical protein
MAANDLGINELVFNQAGRWITWLAHTTSGTAINAATGSAGSAGVSVSGSQISKIVVLPHSCTIDFNVQMEFMDESAFYRIDQSERLGVTYPWTQEVNTAGVSRIYINVSSFTANGPDHRVDIRVGKCVSGSVGS